MWKGGMYDYEKMFGVDNYNDIYKVELSGI